LQVGGALAGTDGQGGAEGAHTKAKAGTEAECQIHAVALNRTKRQFFGLRVI
jgi:hypothetical protein